jgi:amidase
MTVAIKDVIDVAGVPTFMGSLLVDGVVPLDDAECVRRLLDAGADIVGKTTTEDMCIGGASCTSLPRPVVNPIVPDRSAGGSSSGSAVVLATGQAELALGVDQGGSIRIPAALCGVVGLKPTHGLVPFSGIPSLVPSLDHVGPMARRVAEVARALDVLAGPDGVDRRQRAWSRPEAQESCALGVSGMRIGLLREGFSATEAGEAEHPGSLEAAAVVRRAAEALRDQGASVVEVSVPWHADARHIYVPILLEASAAILWRLYGRDVTVLGEGVAAPTRQIADALAVSPELASDPLTLVGVFGEWYLDVFRGRSFSRASLLVRELTADYDRALAEVDVLVCPTTAPAGIADFVSGDPDRLLAESLAYFHNTCATNLTGHPAVSVPVGTVQGAPVGLMVTAARGSDGTALRVAAALESQVSR